MFLCFGNGALAKTYRMEISVGNVGRSLMLATNRDVILIQCNSTNLEIFMNPIIPTVGRIVYFTPAAVDDQSVIPDWQSGVCAALVTAVHNDNCVNLAVFDVSGNQYARCSVCHVSTVTADDDVKKYDTWDWMPYQKGQAAKTEALEQKLCSGSVGCDPQVVISDASFSVASPNKSKAQAKMDFGDAIQALKQGHAVARQNWNGKGMWIALGEGNPVLEADKFWNPHSKQHALNQGGTAAVAPYIIFKNAQDEIQMGWQPSQQDVLSVDWLIID